MTGFAGVLDAKRPRRLRKLRNCIGRGAAGGNYCCCGACRSGVAEGSNYRRKELRRRNLSAQPVGSKNREKHSLLERDDATEGDERGMGLPAGREIREILSLLDVKDAAEGDERGMGLPTGREIREILSLLDGESKLAGDSERGVGQVGNFSGVYVTTWTGVVAQKIIWGPIPFPGRELFDHLGTYLDCGPYSCGQEIWIKS
jgi:hypothetical protein